jgi:hypothetical protein
LTPDEHRVLEAIAWSERALGDWYLPLKRIATMAMGGNSDAAARVLASLDRSECIHTDTMGWQTGWLTPRGRRLVQDP